MSPAEAQGLELRAFVQALHRSSDREATAAELARQVGARRLFLLVADPRTEALIPAPGMTKTLRAGPRWREFLARLEDGQLAHGEVDVQPESHERAVGMRLHGCAVIFVGTTVPPALPEAVLAETPLLAALLRMEYELRISSLEAQAAVEQSRHAHALAVRLDAARATAAELAHRLELEHRRKDEFIAVLAHELRNPLAPIGNALEILRRMEAAPRETVQHLVALMGRQMVQMRRLLDDLLDVARLGQGKVRLRIEPVPLASVLQSAIDTARPLIAEKQQNLEADDGASAGVIHCDAARIGQVIGNLLLNASKYSPPQTHIRLSTAHDGDSVQIAVADQGVGIPADQLQSIFGLFSQIEASLPYSRGGLGVGLALAKSLTELHGGTLSARSEGAGKGSTFTISLPRQGPPLADADP